MIKQNELMIGNIVCLNNGEEVKVISIGEFSIRCLHKDGRKSFANFNTLIPLKISESTLLKLGFKWNELWGSYILNGFIIEKIGDLLCERRYGICIKNLHQLQNTFFIITSKKL